MTMPCPTCRYDNFQGEETCANCGADLVASDAPESAIEYRDTVLGEHLEALGIGSFQTIEVTAGVADAIRQMHLADTDCLLVLHDGTLVGIFTDRDALAKATDKRLALYTVGDFMTPDPVVLRREDTLAIAIHKMAVGEFRHIPIVDEGKPIGVVAAADLFRKLVSALG